MKYLAAMVVCASAGVVSAQISADIVFVVDESGSMAGEHAWIQNMVTALDANLVARGVGDTAQGRPANRYSLVGFGAANPAPRKIPVGGGDFGSAAQLSTAATGLVISGSTEDGWAGINYSLNPANYTYRGFAAKNIILITDEDRDNWDNVSTFAGTRNNLLNNGFILNSVVNATFVNGANQPALGVDSQGNAYRANGAGGYTTSGGGTAPTGAGTTIADYVRMAWDTRGAGWDLNQLRAGGLTATSFTNAFVDIKTSEIIQPGSLQIVKFFDVNQDGIFNMGELTLSGWQFQVEGPNGFSQLVTTDGTGQFTLTGLTAFGNYQITEILQPGWTSTTGLVQNVNLTAGLAAGAVFGNIPTPGALALFAVGGLFAARRRR